MPKSCGHELTEILESDESLDGSGVVLVSRLEACVICGQRRTVTQRSGEVSAGPWEPFRLSVTLDPHMEREPAMREVASWPTATRRRVQRRDRLRRVAFQRPGHRRWGKRRLA